MKDKEYIERGALLKELERFPHLQMAGSIVRSMPKEDVVEVVRCKDCIYCSLNYPAKMKGEEPQAVYSCQVHRHGVSPDEFCCYGERKGQE